MFFSSLIFIQTSALSTVCLEDYLFINRGGITLAGLNSSGTFAANSVIQSLAVSLGILNHPPLENRRLQCSFLGQGRRLHRGSLGQDCRPLGV